MDRGFENQVNIQLLTNPGWCGNTLLPPNRQIGSNFLNVAGGTITIDKLNDIRQAAQRALENQSFGNITPTVRNPESDFLDIDILIEPPGKDIQVLQVQRNWGNWVAQAQDPAYRRE